MALTEKYLSSSASGSGDGLSEGSPFTYSQMMTEIGAAGGQGKRYNIKADGTYNRAQDDFRNSFSGTQTNPIYLRGYKTTPGDGYLGRATNYGALDTTNMPLIVYGNGFKLQAGECWAFESLRINGNVVTALVETKERCQIVNCSFQQTGTSGNMRNLKTDSVSVVIECDFTLNGPGGENAAHGTRTTFDSCRVVVGSATCVGIRMEGDGGAIYGCLIKGNGGPRGIESGNSGAFIRNNTITGFVTGIEVIDPSRGPFIHGNMITDNSGYAMNITNTSAMVTIGMNRLRDNALGNINSAGTNWIDAGRVFPQITTDTGGPESDYVNAAGLNFNLIDTSPGKSANVWKYADMGAYQRQEPAGGGGGSAVFNPLAQTIIRPA